MEKPSKLRMDFASEVSKQINILSAFEDI